MQFLALAENAKEKIVCSGTKIVVSSCVHHLKPAKSSVTNLKIELNKNQWKSQQWGWTRIYNFHAVRELSCKANMPSDKKWMNAQTLFCWQKASRAAGEARFSDHTEKHSAAGLNLAWNIHMHSISFWPAQPENEAMCIFYQKQIFLAMPLSPWNILSSRECSGWRGEHYQVAIAAASTSERLNNAITPPVCVISCCWTSFTSRLAGKPAMSSNLVIDMDGVLDAHI